MVNKEYKPKISVLIPAYNVSHYVVRCLKSISKQTFKDFEVIIIDDGSTDDTSKVVSQYINSDERFRLIRQKNGGVSSARTRALEESKGAYITFIDPDDYVSSDYLEFLYYLLKQDKFQSNMSLCSIKDIFPETNNVLDHGNGQIEKLSGKECLELMCYNDKVDTSCVAKLVKRELYFSEEFVGFKFGKSFEDMGTTYSLFEQCDSVMCGFIAKYFYEIRDNSITTSVFNQSKLDLIEMTDQMAASVTEKFPDLKRATDRRKLYARFSTLNQTIGVKGSRIKKIRHQLIDYINNNKEAVLSDPKTPKRDRIACLVLSLGMPCYTFIWGFYCRFVLKKKIH